MNSFVVRFLTRDGCHLCEEAWLVVKGAVTRVGVEVVVVDVDTEDELRRVYGTRVPVLIGPAGEMLHEGASWARRDLVKKLRRMAGA